MIEKQIMTPVQIQRIVDGECSHEERAELLRSLSEQSGEWRLLALSLLEEQQWSREVSKSDQTQTMRSVDCETLPMMMPFERGTGVPPATGSKVQAMNLGRDSQATLILGRDAQATANNGGRPLRNHWTAALAASLLLLVGYYGGSWMRMHFSDSTQSSPSIALDTTSSPAANPTLTVADPGLQSRSPWDDRTPSRDHIVMTGEDATTSEIPLYSVDQVDPNVVLAKEAYEVARLNRELRRRGYEMDVQPQYYSGKLRDGRQVVVPIHNVALKPFGL